MHLPDDLPARVNAALAGALASGAGPASLMLGAAESLASSGCLDVDDLRRRDLLVPAASPAELLLRVLPYGLATPLDRPRLRRDAYRYAGAVGVDEGTAVTCVGAALVAADLCRFDAALTAIRVRQSLLEDAPMALLNSFILLDGEVAPGEAPEDPGAVLQVALSAVASNDGAPVSTVLAALGEVGRGVAGSLAAAYAGLRAGSCDIPLDDTARARVDAVATALAGLGAAASV